MISPYEKKIFDEGYVAIGRTNDRKFALECAKKLRAQGKRATVCSHVNKRIGIEEHLLYVKDAE